MFPYLCRFDSGRTDLACQATGGKLMQESERKITNDFKETNCFLLVYLWIYLLHNNEMVQLLFELNFELEFFPFFLIVIY